MLQTIKLVHFVTISNFVITIDLCQNIKLQSNSQKFQEITAPSNLTGFDSLKRKLRSDVAKFEKLRSCEIFACDSETFAVLGELLRSEQCTVI